MAIVQGYLYEKDKERLRVINFELKQIVNTKIPHWKHKTKLSLLAAGGQKIESQGSGI